MDDDKNMIDFRDVNLKFGSAQILKNINFNIKQGDSLALLGANGSGKTSLIRVLLDLYSVTSGEVLLYNKKQKVNEKIKVGYLPEERGLYKNESVADVMQYFGRLKGISKRNSETWILNFLKQVGLEDKAKVKIRKLSGGQQQKIQLGVTMMDDPDLLILDEPTKGFDPVNKQLLMDVIKEAKSRSRTIILVTHDMSEVEEVCERAVMLKNGEVIEDDTLSDLRKKYGMQRMHEVFVKLYGETEKKSA